MLEQIRIKVDSKRQSLQLSNNLNEKNEKIINLIDDLLLDDACFLKLDVSMAMMILTFLGYTKLQAKELYVSLVHETTKLLEGKYNLVNLPDDNLKNK